MELSTNTSMPIAALAEACRVVIPTQKRKIESVLDNIQNSKKVVM